MALCGSLQNKIKLLTYLPAWGINFFFPTNVPLLFFVAYFHKDRFVYIFFHFEVHFCL